ncbi:hypothetical protein SBOR_1730 [Sclerotinia borealis F-4128]|uniref:Uncharacterized protein n=1 Tax=Sclerotinia borealis (strain F-4128) TaxID=1432307 RepID=W9CTH0_SCLBF|nr:hypothetical protein SBOR_1730 [Sclerotinia borealis F-4128]
MAGIGAEERLWAGIGDEYQHESSEPSRWRSYFGFYGAVGLAVCVLPGMASEGNIHELIVLASIVELGDERECAEDVTAWVGGVKFETSLVPKIREGSRTRGPPEVRQERHYHQPESIQVEVCIECRAELHIGQDENRKAPIKL